MHQSYFSARTTYLFEWWAMKSNDNNWNLWNNFCCLTVNRSIYTKTASSDFFIGENYAQFYTKTSSSFSQWKLGANMVFHLFSVHDEARDQHIRLIDISLRNTTFRIWISSRNATTSSNLIYLPWCHMHYSTLGPCLFCKFYYDANNI